MKKSRKKSEIKFYILFFMLLAISCSSVYSQAFGGGYYRLNTQLLGEDKSLDVINDGANNKLHLTGTANVSGQFWKIAPVGDGFYRLTTGWLGENKSLDVVNDGANNKLQLADSGDFTGQFWKITPLENGYYRLTTKWLGAGRSLEVAGDGANNQLQLAASGNFSGQSWKITKISSAQENVVTASASGKDREFKQIPLAGFKIVIDTALAEKAETKQALNILSERLELIAKILKPKHLERLRNVPIWIQYKLKTDGAMWYHPSKDWLTSNGYPAEMEKSVEIKSIRNFIDWQADQPYMVLHELAHAFENLYLAEMQNKIVAAYENALAGGKYENVPDVRGVRRRHYGMNNKTEYFAELTESYFGKNDFYPFTKEELKEFDPAGYKLMQEAWE